MKKARAILIVVIIMALTGGLYAFNVRRGLNNLYWSKTGIFTVGSATKLITYATLSPYRTFYITFQNTVAVATPLYTNITGTWTIIGGNPFFYDVTAGSAWVGGIYDDLDQ